MTDPTRDKMPAITAVVEEGATDPEEAAAMAARLTELLRRSRVPGTVAAGDDQQVPRLTIPIDEIAGPFIAGRDGRGKNAALLPLLLDAAAAGLNIVVLDPKVGVDTEAWLAMAGHRDVSQSEREAIERGIDPETYRRLYPAVTGDLADQLYARVIFLASYLAAHLAIHADADDVSGRLTRDPRTPGFRLALFEARRLATTEQMRKVAMFTEWALNSIVAGDEARARAKLDRADRILS